MAATETEPKTIVALGDSTTAGTPGFLSPRESPPDGSGNPESQYAYWLMQEYPGWKVLNRGVRGQRTDQILARFDYDVLRYDPDALVVIAGINDLHQGREAAVVKENLTRIYEKARVNGIPLLVCSILPYNIATPEVQRRIHEVNEWIREYARNRGVAFCDTHAAVRDPFQPGRLAGTPDDVHPDVEGYRHMAGVIGPALESLLQEKSAGQA